MGANVLESIAECLVYGTYINDDLAYIDITPEDDLWSTIDSKDYTTKLVQAAEGIPAGTILGSLGLSGLALTFGTREIIADILSGISIIFEGDFRARHGRRLALPQQGDLPHARARGHQREVVRGAPEWYRPLGMRTKGAIPFCMPRQPSMTCTYVPDKLLAC